MSLNGNICCKCCKLLFALSVLHMSWAQETGSITGQVLDPGMASVGNAQITIKNEATGASFSTLSDQTGVYRAPELPPGVYTLTAELAGFRTLVREGIVVRVNDRLRVDLKLEVGQVNETVRVKGTTPLLQTEDATAGQVIDNQKIIDLPLNGRNWLQLATLAPATVSFPGLIDLNTGNQQNVQMSLGGTRGNDTSYLLDSTDNTNFVGSSGAIVFPPVDSLQEFKVETNNYSADTGRLGGSLVNATIKSGSNAFHGTAYDFLRNRDLNARNFFANPTAKKPEFTRNQYGASVGGPFWRDKLLFFLNYEGNRQRQNQILTRQVFTSAQKNGDFASQLGSQIGVDAMGRPVNAGEIYDPLSLQHLMNGSAIRNPFPGNIIPVSRLNPVSKTLIDLVPPPNTSGSPNYVRDLSSPLDIDQFVGRVDWIRSTKNVIFGHFVYSDQNSATAPVLGLPLDGGNGNNLTSNQRQLALGWTHIFNSSNLNEFRLGYVSNLRITRQLQADQDLNAKYGIPLPFPGPGLTGMALMNITGFASIGTSSGTFPQYVDRYEVNDNYSLIRGAHDLKIGILGQERVFGNRGACNNCRGLMSFTGVFTSQPGFGNTSSPVADFLLGTMNDISLGNSRTEKDVGRDLDLYVQDKWIVTPRLTISLGLRYQYHPPLFERSDVMSNVLFGPGFANAKVVVPQGMADATFQHLKDTLLPYIPVVRDPELGRGLVSSNHGYFAPRLGIARQIGTKTVLRAGYGIFYGDPQDEGAPILTISIPVNLMVTAATNTIDPTLNINQSVFGSNPFNRALVNPAYFAIIDPNVKPEFIQMYNLILQHQFGGTWVAEVGFIGNHSSRMLLANQVNDAAPALPSDNSSPQSRRRVATLLGNLPFESSQGWATYNALTLNLEKRFSDGFTLLANYTWSRALGMAGGPDSFSGTLQGTAAAIQNPLDLKREYGPLPYDVINRGVISYSYALPFGKGKPFLSGASPVLTQLIGDWQLNGITTFQGGFPLTPTLSNSLGKTFTNSRPNAVGDPSKTSRQPNDWLSPGAFAVPSPAEITAGNFFGNVGRGSVREPGLVNFDFSIMKSIVVRESLRLQFRSEFFNVMNTPFFGAIGAVNAVLNTATFGKVTQAGDPRVVQLGLKVIF